MAYSFTNEIAGAAMFAAAKSIAAEASARTGKTFWASLSRNGSGCSAYIYVADVIATREVDGYDQVFPLSAQLRLSDHTYNPAFKQNVICGRGLDYNQALAAAVALA
jgi:hypothetical protein